MGLLAGVGALELLARGFPSPTGAESLHFADYSVHDRANLEAWRERRSGIGPHPDLSGPVHHDPVLGWRNRPGLVDFVWQGRPAFSTNAVGMRGSADYAVERTSQRRRVALVGDSFVFGLDQPDGRIFASLLAERLDAEVLNFAVPGYGTDQTYLMLMGEVLAWKPDHVVFGLFAENPQRAQRRFSFYAKPRLRPVDGPECGLEVEGVPVPAPAELLTVGRGRSWALGNSALVRLARRVATRQPEIQAEPPELLELHRRLFAAAQAGVRQIGARLTVLYIPGSGYQKSAVRPVEAALPAWAQEHGFELLNLRQVFVAAEANPAAPAGPYYLPGRHFSPRGHSLVAGVLAEHLALQAAGPGTATVPR